MAEPYIFLGSRGARYTAAQLERMRDGLRKAGWPEVDTASDDALVAKYLSMADPNDPFTKEIQALAGAAPGSAAELSWRALQGLEQWAHNFKAMYRRFPTREEVVAAWGDFGGAVVNYIAASGKTPSTMTPEEKEAFFAPLATLALTTPPGGSMGAAYMQVPTAEERELAWRRDFD